MSVVAELEAALHDQPVNPLRPSQTQDYEEERDRLQKIVHAPPYIQADRGAATKRYRQLNQILAQQAPKKIEEAGRANRVKQLIGEVIAQVITPTMLPQSVMRRNPAGAVDRTLKGEFSSAYKRAALAVKRGLFALDPETTDPNHANLEKYRPAGLAPNGSTFMADAQFPGYMTYSHIPEERWPFAPPVNTAVQQVAAREAKEKATRTPEQIQAAKDRMAAVRAKRKPTTNEGATA